MTSPAPALIGLTARVLHRTRLLPTVSRAVDWMGRESAFQILTYHRVNDDADPFFPAIATSVFEAQMRHVAETYTVLPVDELVDLLARARLPRHALAITFDDGCRDNLTRAAPIISRYGLRPTIFLATGHIGSHLRPWFDEVALAFKTTSAHSVTMPWGATRALGGQDARLDALAEAWQRLKILDEAHFRDALERLLGVLRPYGAGERGDGGNDMLDWADVKALTGAGFSLGAHTVTHPILSRVSLDRARGEIEDSRDAIRDATGTSPRAFAYPNGMAGDYTAEVVRLVRQAGFRCAVTCRFGVNTGQTSPWELCRGGPWETDLPTFALKLAGYRFMRTAGR